MNKTTRNVLIIIVMVTLVGALMLGVFYYSSYKSEANAVADIVNKGNAYMDGQLYEEAISCYEQALELEEGNEELTMAIVEAYMRLAESQGDSDEAIISYLNAISYNQNNKTAYWAISNIFENRGDQDSMLDILKQGFEDTNDSSMESKVLRIEEERARIEAEIAAMLEAENERIALEQERSEMLEPLVELFANEDYDGLKEILRTDEYVSFSDEVIGDASYYLGEYDEMNNRTGTGVAVYENGYYYYGEFENNVRCGHGVLMRAQYAESSSIGSFIFDGEWVDDKPNGIGSARSNYYKDRISGNDFTSKEITGNYTDGLEDGDMTLVGTTKSGSKNTFKYKTEAGVADKVSNEDSGVKGQYIIAVSGDQKLTSDGSIRGVEGFVEEE